MSGGGITLPHSRSRYWRHVLGAETIRALRIILYILSDMAAVCPSMSINIAFIDSVTMGGSIKKPEGAETRS